jgi:pimeloyl-ACP methyl ester carboxylesterase
MNSDVNLRTYGGEPYDLVLLHGGPGAPGDMEPIAKRISISFGILEPLLLSPSINDQLEELHSIIKEHCNYPVVFIGHSWGAWLGFIFTSLYPGAVKKLIMIGAPPFEEKYAAGITETRLARLTTEERDWLLLAEEQIKAAPEKKHSIMTRYIDLMIKADSFSLLTSDNSEMEFYPAVFYKVWEEAAQLRKNGKLIGYSNNIRCPVVALHGNYDSHPAAGVKEPLSNALKNFRFTLLENCGHYPWKEKYAKDILYKLFYKEIGSPCV